MKKKLFKCGNGTKKFTSFRLLTLLLTILTYSCQAENELVKTSYDYSSFHNFKNKMKTYDFGKVAFDMKHSEKKYSKILAAINNEFKLDMRLNIIDYELINSANKSDSHLEIDSNYFNENDIELLNKFEHDLNSSNFSTAIKEFEKSVFELDLSEYEINKYDQFANVMCLIHFVDSESLEYKFINNKITDPCGEAIAAYSLATIGLSACGLSGPLAPIVCSAAIAAKVLAFRAMVRDC